MLPKSTSHQGTEDRQCNARKGQEKKVHFDEPNADEDRKDPTGLIAEDATYTRQGSEDSIDEMSEDEAKKILLSRPLLKARQRTNIVSDDYILEGRLFGSYAAKREGIAQATFRFPLSVKALMKIASTRDVKLIRRNASCFWDESIFPSSGFERIIVQVIELPVRTACASPTCAPTWRGCQ